MLGSDCPLVHRAHGQIHHLAAIWVECKELITFTPIFLVNLFCCLPACRTLCRARMNICGQYISWAGCTSLVCGITEWDTVESAGEGHNDCKDLEVSIFRTPCLPGQGENAKP